MTLIEAMQVVSTISNLTGVPIEDIPIDKKIKHNQVVSAWLGGMYNQYSQHFLLTHNLKSLGIPLMYKQLDSDTPIIELTLRR